MKTGKSQLRRNRENVIFTHKFMIFLGVFSASLLLVLWATSFFMEPAPPKRIIMTSGSDGGSYSTFAKKYAEALKKDGVILDVRSSAGSIENYERLKDPASEYDIAFVQSGIGHSQDAPNLQTLASLYYEPIWVFYRGNTTMTRLSQLRGKRVGINVPGSGIRKVALDLLGEYKINSTNTKLESLSTANSIEALRNGTLDAAFFISGPQAPTIQTLLKSNLKLMSFDQADSLIRRFPSLSKVTFPRGAIDLDKNLPSSDITLISETALLVAKDTLHPAIAYLLLNKIQDIHGGSEFFSERGTFPNQKIEDFPIADEAKRYSKSGSPFLQRYMPFWLANFIERMLILLVPIIAMAIPLFQLVSAVYDFNIKVKLVRWYGEIKLLEDEIHANKHPAPEQIVNWTSEIDDIEFKVHELDIPQLYIDNMYSLKQSINVVRERILTLAQEATEPTRPVITEQYPIPNAT